MAVPRYDVFLSHSSKDSKFAKKVCEIINETGLHCFLDETAIKGGDKWMERIEEALKSSAQVVFLLTKNAEQSAWVRTELGMARALRKEIFPVLAGPEADVAGILSVLRGFGLHYDLVSPTGNNKRAIEKLAKRLAERNDFVGFWVDAFLNYRPLGQGIHIVMSAKPPREMFQGQAEEHGGGHTTLVSYNEVCAFLKLRPALVGLSDDPEIKINLHHGGLDLRQGKIPVPDKIRPLGTKWRDSDTETVVIDLKGSDDFRVPEVPLNENLIIIGSVHANLICETLLHALKEQPRGLPFSFEVEEQDSEQPSCPVTKTREKSISWDDKPFPGTGERSDKSKIEIDYGVLVRVRNPFRPGNRVLILAGNHGFGTQAAVQFVSSGEYIRQLQEKAARQLESTDDVAVLFQARVRGEQGLAENLEILRIAKSDGKRVWQPVCTHNPNLSQLRKKK
jgi:TIR domain-containing protein